MRPSIAGFSLALASASAFAFDSAVIRTTHIDGTVVERTVPLEKQDGGFYRIRISVGDIKRGVEYIDVIADQAVARKGEAGWFVVGDGSYGEFTQDEGFYSRPNLNHMPIFGMKNPRGAFVAIVKGLVYEQLPSIEAVKGVYKVFPRFNINGMYFDAYEDIVVDFYPLVRDQADYSGMAKVYRDYQIGRGEVRLLRDRVKDNPVLAYSADSMYVRVKHCRKKVDPKNPAHRMQTPETEPPLEIFHDFDDFTDIMNRMRAEGIEKAEICSVGWNIGGHDGRFPQYFPVEPKIGGEAKFRESIKIAHSLGYQITCHINQFAMFYLSSRWNENDVAKRPDGSLMAYDLQPSGIPYLPCFERVYNLWVRDDFKQIADLGIKGLFHIDVTSMVNPYPCCDPRHPLNRKQTANYQNQIGEYAREIFGGFASEGGSDHVAKTLDYALYIWNYPSWQDNPKKLATKYVPLWQLVYHGIILSNPYYSTIDALYPKIYTTSDQRKAYDYLGDPETRWLKVIEFNGRPTFYYTDYKDLKPMKRAYDEYQPLKHLQYQLMTHHEEVSPEVFLTRFDNGEEVIVNYSATPFKYKEAEVAPRDYKAFKTSDTHAG